MLLLEVNNAEISFVTAEYRLPINVDEKYQLFFVRPQTLSEWFFIFCSWFKGNMICRTVHLTKSHKLFGFFTFINIAWAKEFLIAEEKTMVC